MKNNLHLVEWHLNFHYESENQIYFVDQIKSFVGIFNPNDMSKITNVGGVAYNNSYKDGPCEASFFNNPHSILAIKIYEDLSELERNKWVLAFKDWNCAIA